MTKTSLSFLKTLIIINVGGVVLSRLQNWYKIKRNLFTVFIIVIVTLNVLMAVLNAIFGKWLSVASVLWSREYSSWTIDSIYIIPYSSIGELLNQIDIHVLDLGLYLLVFIPFINLSSSPSRNCSLLSSISCFALSTI